MSPDLTDADYDPYEETAPYKAHGHGGHPDGYTVGTTARATSTPQIRSAVPSRKHSIGADPEAGDVDDSAWIHRDKLAQIESWEMAAAGIRVRRDSRHRGSAVGDRSESRSASRMAKTAQPGNSSQPSPSDRQDGHDRISHADDEWLGPNLSVHRDSVRQRDTSADFTQYEPNRNRSSSRPITSRIPVAKASPAPLPNAVVDRDSPMQRNRAASNTFNGEGSVTRKPRPRSQSLGSQAVMDDIGSARESISGQRPASSHLQGSPKPNTGGKPSPSGSTMRGKAANKPATAVSSRKRTDAQTPAKPRTTSATRKTSPGARPTTSGTMRPASSTKRPEGEAPWIATMYKPDPRLPQDQQILPTHAKRMLQEQWEKDGKTGNAYDKDFNLLNDSDLAKMGAFPSSSPTEERAVPKEASLHPSPGSPQGLWPITSNNSDTRSNTRSPGLSQVGGYKITPTVPLPKPSMEDRPAFSTEITGGGRKQSVQRVPDLEKDEDAKDKGCACCIIM